MEDEVKRLFAAMFADGRTNVENDPKRLNDLLHELGELTVEMQMRSVLLTVQASRYMTGEQTTAVLAAQAVALSAVKGFVSVLKQLQKDIDRGNGKTQSQEEEMAARKAAEKKEDKS